MRVRAKKEISVRFNGLRGKAPRRLRAPNEDAREGEDGDDIGEVASVVRSGELDIADQVATCLKKNSRKCETISGLHELGEETREECATEYLF